MDSAIGADWASEGKSVIRADSAIGADWASERKSVPEPKTEGNASNRRPTNAGNRGTIGLTKIRIG